MRDFGISIISCYILRIFQKNIYIYSWQNKFQLFQQDATNLNIRNKKKSG